jgi:phosphonate transport system substrate-binding protein
MRIAGIVLALLLIQGGMAKAEAEKPLTLGFMPYLNAAHLIEKYQPLATYLSARLDREVEIVVARNYVDHIRRTGEDKLDISFLGGSPYVAITDQFGPKPILAGYEFDGKGTFRAVIFVRKDSPVASLSQLAGKRFAFGNADSTLSTQVPLWMLMEAGVGLDRLGEYRHLRNHENVALGVRFGDFDAGAVAEEVFGEIQGDDLRILARSPDLATHLFVARRTLPPALRDRIRTALIDLKKEPGGAAILRSIAGNLTGFLPVEDRDYDLLRTMLEKVLPVLGTERN